MPNFFQGTHSQKYNHLTYPNVGSYVVRVTDTNDKPLLYLCRRADSNLHAWMPSDEEAIRFNLMGNQNSQLVLRRTLAEINNAGMRDLKKAVYANGNQIKMVKLSAYSLLDKENFQSLQIML